MEEKTAEEWNSDTYGFHCRCGAKAAPKEVCCQRHLHLCSECFREPRMVDSSYCPSCDPLNGSYDALIALWTKSLHGAERGTRLIWSRVLGAALYQ